MEWHRAFQYLYSNGVPMDVLTYFHLEDRDVELNTTVSGYNARTFPNEGRFRDEDGWFWIKEGGNLFSFKTRRAHRPVPDTIRILRGWRYGWTIELKCRVIFATINNLLVLDEGRQKEYDGPPVSTVCGRGALVLEECHYWKE